MRVYITNQKIIVKVVGVSPEHLSAIKNNKVASEALAETLEGITGIPTSIWLSADKDHLRASMRQFFMKERAAEDEFIGQHIAMNQVTEQALII